MNHETNYGNDYINELKKLVKNIENIKSHINIFSILVDEKINLISV